LYGRSLATIETGRNSCYFRDPGPCQVEVETRTTKGRR
jgi:hypothetical protein